MLKPSGLKIPGRTGKHSSPVGRASGTAAATVTTGTKEGSPLHKQSATSTSSAEKSGSKAAEVGDDFLGDFVVGERVWVNGVKPGVIQYLGETQFAPGQWAGVVLDDPVGKNDGSVGGVRYFECQPLQGIFTRPSKLTRQPVAEGSGSDGPSVDSLTAQNLSLHSGTATPPLSTRVIPLRESVLNSAMKTGNESGSNLSDSGSVKKGEKDLRLGDRVLSDWWCTCAKMAYWKFGPAKESFLQWRLRRKRISQFCSAWLMNAVISNVVKKPAFGHTPLPYPWNRRMKMTSANGGSRFQEWVFVHPGQPGSQLCSLFGTCGSNTNSYSWEV